ncbi:MAG: hypothetical protein U0670_17170 [Anaerolineae bacterium]
MAVVLIAGAILPLFRNSTSATATAEPTQAVTPTFPPPITDFSNISLDQVYLHPGGLFAVSQPTGWDSVSPNSNSGQAGANMVNTTQQSVIDVSVQPSNGITTAGLSDYFTQGVLRQSWANFSNWTETNRRMEGDRLLIDFVVTYQSQQYVARQISYTDGDWIYNTRVLAPNNAADVITYMMSVLPDRFIPFKQFLNTPFEWLGYYDAQYRTIIRYPSNWTLADEAPGRLASITGANGEALRLTNVSGQTIADETAAAAYAQSVRPNITVLSTEAVTHGDLSGFSVAYTFSNVDGEPQSGAMVLLNDEGALHTADLYFPARNVDLNTVQTVPEQIAEQAAAAAEATPEATGEVADAFGSVATSVSPTIDTTQQTYAAYATILATFSRLPVLNLSPQSLPATPTPIPTVAPPTIVVPEITLEVTAEATVEATTVPTEAAVEATVEATADATAEATAEATAAQ